MEEKHQLFLDTINEHQRIIYKVCHLYTDDKHDFADLYQEVVYQLWKSFDSFSNKSKISTWIYKVALNTALYHLRNKRKHRSYSLDDIQFDPEIPEEANELMDQLKEMIEALNPFEKTLIMLQLEGLSYKEIANITGLSVTNVGTRLNRIKNKLKKMANNNH